jgi:hypothetical protein
MPTYKEVREPSHHQPNPSCFRMAATAQQQIAAGQFYEAWSSWNNLLQFIDSKSASVVSVYNH